jgi:hypothetical protein
MRGDTTPLRFRFPACGANTLSPVMIRALPSLILLLLGLIAALLFDGTAGTAITVFLVGSALVVAVSTVFYEVGRSEDRERERR